MNWIDYTIVAILFFSALFGLANGPFLQFFGCICMLISFYTAFFFHSFLGNIIKGVFTPSTTKLVSYFIIFGVAFIITFILTDIIKRVMVKWNTRFGLRLFGALFGIFKGLIFCGVIIFSVLSFCSKPTCDTVNTSKIAARIGKGMQTMAGIIPEDVSNRIKNYTGELKERKKPKDAGPAKNKDGKSSL